MLYYKNFCMCFFSYKKSFLIEFINKLHQVVDRRYVLIYYTKDRGVISLFRLLNGRCLTIFFPVTNN